MPDEAYNVHHSVTRKERAEADAVRKAEETYLKSPAALEIRELGNRVQQLENYIRQLRGEEGIDNEGPIFRLSKQPRNAIASLLDGFEEVELTFCDDNDVEHTGTFLVKDITPPL